MINKVQSKFSIQDLELLSGIKAHTIRIWEKRYELLNPTRLNRNIRVYDLLDLQKILNVSLLQKKGLKISEISKLADRELEEKAKAISLENFPNNYYVNSLLVSMFSLDEGLFEEIYANQIKEESFKTIYTETFLPLLIHIGFLWQTNSISPAQEHFISNLIYQKIIINIATLPPITNSKKKVNILFLPEGEMHELSLLFMMYLLKLNGERTIYFGRDIPFDNLRNVNLQFQEINWICSFVIDRSLEEKNEFVSQMKDLLKNTTNTCWIIGNIWNGFSNDLNCEAIKVFTSFDQVEV